MLRVSEVSTGYGRTQVLRGVSLNVERGEFVGLFGPNGHGKTTLLRLISGLLPIWDGEILFDGKKITSHNPGSLLKQGLVHVAQGNTLFRNMTVEENLGLGAFVSGWRERRQLMERVFLTFPKLAERRRQLASTLSGGERQMVSIGIGLMSEPKMLLLDEPTLGLAPKIRGELSLTIRNLAATGVTLLVVDQDLEFLQLSTQRSYLLEGGRIVMETDLSKEISNTEILKHYFGIQS